MTIGDRMKAQRKALKISVDELAARLGKDRSTIYRYEKGEIENVPLELLEPIAAALETTPQYLMGWEQNQKEDENKKESDAMAGITARMFEDKDFFRVVSFLNGLDEKQFNRVKVSLSNLFEEAFDVYED